MQTRQTDRQPLYAKIHIARKQLGMSDDIYRGMLEERFGVNSSSQLKFKQLSELVHLMADMGAEYTTPKKAKNKTVMPHSRPDWIEVRTDDPYASQKRKILALWKKLGYSMSSLDTRVKRQFGVESFAWLHNLNNISLLLNDLLKREKACESKSC